MTDSKTNKEIPALIAGALKKHNEVQVRGLGTFQVRHNQQNQRQEKDGRVILTPPRDEISFVPEKQ
jgi:nucleoid DNA-binding protein